MTHLRSLVVLVALVGILQAEDAPAIKQGHSLHGEVFNDGPRQKAYLMSGMPQVHLTVTTKQEEAQKFFDQGLGQLHGFWFYEAERSFRQAAAIDADCAMAYWGLAMANVDNAKRGKQFAAEAVKRREQASAHERMYIDAIDAFFKADENKKKQRSETFAKSFEKILYEYPDDVEAKALLVLHLWKASSDGVKIESFLAVNALLDQIFAVVPMHPAHHYRIHLWDDERAANAVTSAARCGQSGPGIAHLWHMPGHTFSKLKRYDDAVWQQEASARVDHAHMMRDRVLPDQIHNFAHNNEWCIRNMLHVGRVSDAIALAKNMCELPRHPNNNTFAKRGSAALGRERLLLALSEYELWDELLALSNTSYIEPTDIENEQLRRMRAIATANYRTGHTAAGDVFRIHFARNAEELKLQQDAAGEAAAQKARDEKKEEKDITKARDEACKSYNERVEQWQKASDEAQGNADAARGDFKSGYELLAKAGCDAGYVAWLKLLAGQTDDAIKAAQSYVNDNANEVLPLCRQVEILWRADKKEEARAAMDKLRELSRSIDLQAPIFQRVTEIAKQLGYPGDWRVPKPWPADVGERPELASLGPARWEPSPAREFTVKNAAGQELSLNHYQGKPVVLIFFLGHGCLHCAQQLHAFAPLKDKFAAAGLELLAISSDDLAGLQKSIENFSDAPLPMPLASDESLAAFKSYRCFDDFEGKPLHGTFVIDAAGRVRWQDISFDPFMDANFVLGEAKRLLQVAK